MLPMELRREQCKHLSPNPYDLYPDAEAAELGKKLGIGDAEDIQLFQRRLRDAAYRCLVAKAQLPPELTPTKRAAWLRKRVSGPARKVIVGIGELRAPGSKHFEDLNVLLHHGGSRVDIQRKLDDVKRQLWDLHHLIDHAADLVKDGKSDTEQKFLTLVVEELSQVFLQYRGEEFVGVNSRYPQNSLWMTFVRQTARPIIGRAHQLKDQMQAFAARLHDPRNRKSIRKKSKVGSHRPSEM